MPKVKARKSVTPKKNSAKPIRAKAIKQKKGISPTKATTAKKKETTTKVSRKRKSTGDKMGCISSKQSKLSDSDTPYLVDIADSSSDDIKIIEPIINDKNLLGDWNHADFVAKNTDVTKSVAKTVIQLFDNENTIPFIARYRKSQTNGLDADKLREMKETYDRAKAIKHKAEIVIKSIKGSGKDLTEISNALVQVKTVRSLNELEEIHSLYKPASKRTLAARARERGLGPIAEAVLKGDNIPHLRTLINSSEEGLESEEEIKEGIICIIAEAINKDNNTFEKIRELRAQIPVKIETIKTKTKQKNSENQNSKKLNDHKKDEDKYKNYYNWTGTNRSIQNHQILAINRAEKEKVISVAVTVPDHFEKILKKSVLENFQSAMSKSKFHAMLISTAFDIGYKKSIKPAIMRRTRSEMNERAEEASMEVFARNVKQLLLSPPVRGKVVLGIDPGFTHGCKLGVVSEQGDVLETRTIYLHRKDKGWSQDAVQILVGLILKHKISMIALGNGTACRETESILSRLIKSGEFGNEDILYSIVDEAGASVYSCSQEAKSEFSKLDCNVISAISIARRLQDPLAELVKVDPKHLGVGMYQHDLPEKQLMSKLNEVVIEAVSFVGVDVNTASQSLLRRIAGLSETKAANIIEWRKQNGSFINREQLRKVKGIGSKTFEQCAGFIRILPETAQRPKSSIKNGFNYLDQTDIHPESYKVANAFIRTANIDLADLGTRPFISAVKTFVAKQRLENLTRLLDIDETTLNEIINGLTKGKNDDIRLKGNSQVFRNSLRTINDLTEGALLTGVVRNIVDFGAFIDIGVESNGLIHVKHLRDITLGVGQRVNVKIEHLEKDRGRIGLVLAESVQY